MTQTTTDVEVIGSREACELLGGINRSTLTRLVASGVLAPAGRLGPPPTGAFVFRRGDVERLAGERAA